MKDRYLLFEKICQILADSADPRQTLTTIVTLVAEQLGIDVCSVYLISPVTGELVLRASAGLSSRSVDAIRMNPREGLTGLVLEKAEPLFVRNPASHERYKYFEDSGEEKFKTYMGAPLRYHRKNFGAIVFQTMDPDALTEKDIPFFSAIAGQIASLVAFGGIMDDIDESRKHPPTAPPKKPAGPVRGEKTILRGAPAAPGIAEGVAHYLIHSIGFDQVRMEHADNPVHEAARFETALKANMTEIRELTGSLGDLSVQDAAIFESHLMMLTDPSFKKQVLDRIRKGVTAEYALKETTELHINRFMAIDDPYLRERAKDVEDVGKQILAKLLGEAPLPDQKLLSDTILIAADISPKELLSFRQRNLKGLALARGGKTSHAAILSKSFEIPMVIGLSGILDQVLEGDRLILDGNSGILFRNPSEDILAEYEILISEKKKLLRQLQHLKKKPSVTKDGHLLHLDANIGLISDTALAKLYGAEDIGLYRTEFPFIIRDSFPSEAEQVGIYAKVLEGVGEKTVTIRTLDVGGDKYLSYFDSGKEGNPYLGWRSIRVSLDREDIFKTQLRAILRVSATRKAKLLFPMICSVKEAKRIVQILSEVKSELTHENIPFDPDLPIGAMVEVPGAVKILGTLLTIFDFISIGTNDLIQYLLAVDRNNPKVASLYNPLHPAVIATIREAVLTCREAGKPVSICGEAAGNPKCAYLFLAMGVDALSMTPSAIPGIKQIIRKSKLSQAKEDLTQVLKMTDEDDIGRFLETRLAQL